MSVVTEDATEPSVVDNELRFLIIGKSGNGKSALCNMILGQTVFQLFSLRRHSLPGAEIGEVSWDHFQIKVIDTPDLSKFNMSQAQLKQEVNRWRNLTAPFPTAILFTVRCDGNFTPDDYNLYGQVKNLWGPEDFLSHRIVVVFTFGDRISKLQSANIVKTASPALKKVLNEAQGRHVIFNNKANKKLKGVQLDQLFSILGIDSVRHVDDAVPVKVWEYSLVIPGCLVVLLVIATVVFIFQQRYILALVCVVVGAVVGIIVIRRVKKKTS